MQLNLAKYKEFIKHFAFQSNQTEFVSKTNISQSPVWVTKVVAFGVASVAGGGDGRKRKLWEDPVLE
jgi:hypothetical protein